MMTLSNAMEILGPGARIVYLGFDYDRWYCDIKLPRLHYSVTLTTADGSTPEDALENAVTRARTKFAKEQEGDKVA